MYNKKIATIPAIFLFILSFSTYGQNWYDEAEQRIDTLRKGDFSFKVVDAGSNPVHDSVFIKLKKHEFQWGNLLTHPSYDQADFDWYQSAMLKYFNAANVERFKWNYMETYPDTLDYSEVDTIVSWAEKADWYVRGHCLIWGGEDSWQLPSWIVADTMSGDSMYSACETRIRREVTRYAGEIHEYDVINEPYHETWLTDRTGDSVNWNAFNWARESDPDAKLFVNDFNIIVWPVVNEYVEVIREMLDNGAPIDGIGVQGHMENDIDWEEIRESLDSLSQFGLPITVTEFDMKVDQYSISEEDQADYYGQIMRIMFSYPLVKGFYFFGLYDKYAWREGSGIFNENKIPKIAADTVYHLIHEKWSTSLADSTEADGTCQFSGFYGDYEVTVKTGDSTVIFSVPFTKENESTEIELNLAVASPPHPKLLSVQTNADGSKIELEFDRKMNDPAANADKFSVYSIKELSLSDVSVKTGDTNVIELTLLYPLVYRQKATVSYTFGDLTSVEGGILENFGPEEIDNRLPGFREASTNEEGSQVSVTFSKEMSSEIPMAAFTIEVNGTEKGITAAEPDASDATTILFSLESVVEESTDLILLSYNPGDYESADGYLLGAFGPKYVLNNVPPYVSNLEEGSFYDDISIYPNPADKHVMIESSQLSGQTFHFQLIDVSGRLSFSGMSDFNREIDVSGLEAGIYFLQIKLKGEQITKRIVLK